MRIAVDARELEGRPTGVGRVVSGLLGAWPDLGDQVQLVCRSPLSPSWMRPGWTMNVVPGPRHLAGSLWEQAVLPRALDADVLLAPGYSMPRWPGCPAVVCMHDCAPFALPDTFVARERIRRRWAARVAARHASFLFMGSEFAASEASRWLEVDRSRLLVVPWGLAPGFGEISDRRVAAVRARYRLKSNVVLFVGSQLARRDLGRLAEHLEPSLAASPERELCIVGSVPRGVTPGATGNVRHLGYVGDDDLAGLYAAARVVVYPSRYEGFGLPVLEALACGTAVVASATSAIAEVYAGRAILVPHDDAAAWAAAVRRLLDDAEARSEAVLAGCEWARKQDWTPSAATLRARMAQTLERP